MSNRANATYFTPSDLPKQERKRNWFINQLIYDGFATKLSKDVKCS